MTLTAGKLWGGGIAAFLAADGWLAHTGRETASTWAARHWKVALAVTVYLHLHFHGRPRALAPFDPLHRAACLLRGTDPPMSDGAMSFRSRPTAAP